MDVEGWKIFVWLTALVLTYGAVAALTDTPPTIVGLLVFVVFGGAGLLLGYQISRRLH